MLRFDVETLIIATEAVEYCPLFLLRFDVETLIIATLAVYLSSVVSCGLM